MATSRFYDHAIDMGRSNLCILSGVIVLVTMQLSAIETQHLIIDIEDSTNRLYK